MGEAYDDCEDIAIKIMADMEEKRTFDEWVSLGFRILKGSKAIGRNEHGTALFDATQVIEADDERFNYTDVYSD